MKWLLLAILLSSSGVQNIEILETHSSEKSCIQRIIDAESLDPPLKINFVCCPSACEISSLFL